MKTLRERIFVIVVACVGVLIGGYFLQSWIYGAFDRRSKEITRLKDEIKKFERQSNLGRAASRKLVQYEQRSLPAKVEVARTHYQDWLIQEMELAGLIEPDVRFVSAQGGTKDIFVRQSFAVEAAGTLPDVVELLYSFYSVDLLHRITQLTLRPIKDSKLLDVKLDIEALSLKKAASTDKLEIRPSNRLALKGEDAYYDAIVGRNIFGPRNNEPKLEIGGPLEVFLGRTAELDIKGVDPDPYDQVYVNLVQSPAPEAKIDPLTGKFSWTPKAPGTYEFTVEGTDDGFPAKPSKQEKFTLTVKEQKPAAPKGLEFDHAKFTILTAILSVDGQGEVWLHVRPTGQMVTLHEGDRFEIGSVKGTVAQIGEYDFTFDFEGKRRKVGKGELLEQAKVIADLPQVAAPAQASAGEVEVQANQARL
jgi:hypothetical protein